MAHCNIGQVLIATGETNAGMTHIESAVEKNPENAIAWDALARFRVLAADFTTAEYAAQRAIGIAPEESSFYVRLGITQAAQKRFKDALSQYQRALNLNPTNSEAWAQAGITSFMMNNIGDATEALRRALTLNPADTNARRHLALALLTQGDKDAAIGHFRAILDQTPDDQGAILELAVLYISEHRNVEARESLSSLSSTAQQSPRCRYYHGLLLQREGLVEEAEEVLGALSQENNDYAEKASKLIRTVH